MVIDGDWSEISVLEDCSAKNTGVYYQRQIENNVIMPPHTPFTLTCMG